MDFKIIRSLVRPANTKIVLFVMDGLGGLPQGPSGLTELEAANTPNLDHLARQGICGLHQPIAAGITPGSGPAHLALFGYDPLQYQVGRGVLSALGIGFDLQPQDVAARGNFATVDEAGAVTDRRAGRIPTEMNRELLELLREIRIPGVEIYLETEKEHRFLFVLRGERLSGELADTDPQQVGKKPLRPQAMAPEAERTASLVAQFLEEARRTLSGRHPANMVLLRGFATRPDWPTFGDVFGLNALAIAAYPMYRGAARLVGMQVLDEPTTLEEEYAVLEKRWQDFDFFFIHFKGTDSAGEDGDFDRKVALIEEVDATIPRLMALEPDVVLVTGDHSTPAIIKAHGWQPVPVLVWSEYCRADGVEQFGERSLMLGGLGANLPSMQLMPLALANALRLDKFGA